jgi:hypothetical protein
MAEPYQQEAIVIVGVASSFSEQTLKGIHSLTESNSDPLGQEKGLRTKLYYSTNHHQIGILLQLAKDCMQSTSDPAQFGKKLVVSSADTP